MHLIYFKTFWSQVFYGMFKDVLLALLIDLRGLCLKVVQTPSTVSCEVEGRPVFLAGHKSPSFMNLSCHLHMDLLSCASFRNFVRNAC